MLETVDTISEGGGLDLTALDMERVESLQWASKKTDSVKDAEDFDFFRRHDRRDRITNNY